MCKKYSGKWRKQFLVSCNQCREAHCSSCVTSKSSVEILIKTLDSDGKNYVQNFITDFLKITNETLQHLFKVERIFIESRSKLKTFDVNVYQSEKNRSQVVYVIPKKDKKDNEDPEISSLKIEKEKEGEENTEESSQES